jgi:hypothetical protein
MKTFVTDRRGRACGWVSLGVIADNVVNIGRAIGKQATS